MTSPTKSLGTRTSTSMIGSSRIGLALDTPFLKASEPATLKAISERVDGVIGAVDQGDLEIDKGVAGNDALLHGLDDAFLDRRPVLLRDDAADDLVEELETARRAAAAPSRSVQSPNWPRPPVCFLCRPWTVTLPLMVSR